MQGVARHLVGIGKRLEICTNYPDVYRPLNGKVTLVPYRRVPVDCVAHYANRRAFTDTDQFEDCCINAGVPPTIEFKIEWQVMNVELVTRLRAVGRPVVVVQMPRPPFGREDRFGMEFLPDCRTIQRAIDRLKGRAFLIQIGQGEPEHRYTGIDLDLSNRTTVADVIDIGFAAQGFLGQCSFIIPLAEQFAKPVLIVWSRRGLQSREHVIRQMTPGKILHLPSSRHVIDDCSDLELNEAVDALCDAAGAAALV